MQSAPQCESDWCYVAAEDDFTAIPGRPLAYWLSDSMRAAFQNGIPLGTVAPPKHGMTTFDNGRFLREWHEVDQALVCGSAPNRQAAVETGLKWFPYNKGGPYRRWHGNNTLLINWYSDGEELKDFIKNKNPNVACGEKFFFRSGVTWSDVSARFAARIADTGGLFDVKGSCAFPGEAVLPWLLGLMNSRLMNDFMEALNPTATSQVGDIARVPTIDRDEHREAIAETTLKLVSLARIDWNAYERSWDFQSLPLLSAATFPNPTLESSYTAWIANNKNTIAEMKRLEEENNRLFIDAYGLQDELSSEVPIEQITLTVNPAYRYGGNLSEDELWNRFRQDTVKELLSYATGCMMGRFSLDHPGLILANAGDTLDNYYAKVGKSSDAVAFRPDPDGIIPVLDGEWFEDDIVARTREFLAVTFPESGVGENLRFIEVSLSKDIRKYFCAEFYKDHLQTYKKRPIYWLVQSPKKGFSCLIYLHRYTKDTLNLVLNNYFRPYLQKLEARQAQLGLDQLNDDLPARERTAARKEAEKITKVLKECQAWEQDALLPLAQQRIELDLDDGVKVNYLKLQDVLAPIPGLAAKED